MQAKIPHNDYYPEEYKDNCSFCVGMGCSRCGQTGIIMSTDPRFMDRMREIDIKRAREAQEKKHGQEKATAEEA